MAILNPGSGNVPFSIDGTGLQAMFPFSPRIGITPNPAAATIYTVPLGYKAIIASIELFNNSGGTANVTIYLTPDATDFPIRGASLNSLDALVDTLSRCLPSGTQLKAVSDVADVTYCVQVNEIKIFL